MNKNEGVLLRLFTIIVCLFACIATYGYAEQINFTKRSVNGATSFYYKWQSLQGEEELSFRLPTKLLREDKYAFKIFDNRKSNDYVYEKMKEYTDANRSRLADIQVKRVRLGFELEAKGRSQQQINQAIEALKDVRQKAMDEYVYDNYYTYIDEANIKPDHVRIARDYVQRMQPVAQAIADKVGSNDYRQVTNYALSFLQAVPYDILKSRYTSNGAGFQMPYSFLLSNRGDCDTKAVVLASILRNFYPNLRMMMVYIPEHAFIGLAIPVEKGDMALKINGTTFVLAEPVGPRQYPIGKVADTSRAKLLSGDYSYSEIPF